MRDRVLFVEGGPPNFREMFQVFLRPIFSAVDTQTAVLVSTTKAWISAPDAQTSTFPGIHRCFGSPARRPIFPWAPVTKTSVSASSVQKTFGHKWRLDTKKQLFLQECWRSRAHTARYCDTIAAVPHIARSFFREVSSIPKWRDTPPWYLVSHRHICAIPHFATCRATIV